MHSRIHARTQGRTLDVLGSPMTHKAAGADLGGGAAVFVCTVAPEGGPPAHYYEDTDASFYLLEGQLDLWIGSRHVKLWPGMSAALPRSVVHRYDNLGERPAKVLIVVTPAAASRFVDDIDRVRPQLPRKVRKLAAMIARHDSQLAQPIVA
jgi:quercetin dioxygenase-like cupin family protein